MVIFKFIQKFLVLISIIFALSPSKSAYSHDFHYSDPFQEKPFLIIGHRGAPLEEVENTLPSFERALYQGANSLELDLVMTKEPIVIVYHDRDPNSSIAIARQLGLENLKYVPVVPSIFSPWRIPIEKLTLDQFRAHYGFALRVPTQKNSLPLTEENRDPDVHLLTLSEFAVWSHKVENAERLKTIFLDIKLEPGQEKLVPVMFKVIYSLFQHSPFRVILMSPYSSIFNSFSTIIDQIENNRRFGITLDFTKEGAYPHIKNYPYKKVSLGDHLLRPWEEYLAEAKKVFEFNESLGEKKNYPLVSWTIDDEKKMKQLININVQGIVTNNPSLLVRLKNN